MSIAVGICGHHSRRDMVERLAAQVNADIISIDPGDLGPNKNHHTVWSELDSFDCTYGVVLEDDCVPVQGFRHQLEQALKAAPPEAPIMSGYLGALRPPQWQQKIRRAIAQADDTGAHYILSTHLLHAVCVAIRHDHIQPVLAFTDSHQYLPWDEAVGAYARRAHVQVAYTYPSICDHADVPTIIAHRDRSPRPPGRVAHRVGTRNTWSAETTVTL